MQATVGVSRQTLIDLLALSSDYLHVRIGDNDHILMQYRIIWHG